MARSDNLSDAPHTSPNTDPPQPGDIVYGRDGIFAVSVVTPDAVHGLLVCMGQTDVVEVKMSAYQEAFATKILMAESIHEMMPGSRLQ